MSLGSDPLKKVADPRECSRLREVLPLEQVGAESLYFVSLPFYPFRRHQPLEELISSLADLQPHVLEYRLNAEMAQRLNPGPCVQVYGIDQSAIDVEDGRFHISHGRVVSNLGRSHRFYDRQIAAIAAITTCAAMF
jgi:hypothetical protein